VEIGRKCSMNPTFKLAIRFELEPTEAFEWFKVERALGNVRSQGSNFIVAV
jgi:hypothetical protein